MRAVLASLAQRGYPSGMTLTTRMTLATGSSCSRRSLDTAPILTPSLVVAWLWIGLMCLLLLDLRARAEVAWSGELVLVWAFFELWLEPVIAGLSNESVFLAVNPLLVVLLWVMSRSDHTGPRASLRRLTYIGSSLLLLLLQWAFAALRGALPDWTVTRFPG